MSEQPNEKELLEILEMAREAEQKARELCKMITDNTAKYKSWAEAKIPVATHKSAVCSEGFSPQHLRQEG